MRRLKISVGEERTCVAEESIVLVIIEGIQSRGEKRRADEKRSHRKTK